MIYVLLLSVMFYRRVQSYLQFLEYYLSRFKQLKFYLQLDLTWNQDSLETCLMFIFREAKDKATIISSKICTKTLYLVSTGRYSTD